MPPKAVKDGKLQQPRASRITKDQEVEMLKYMDAHRKFACGQKFGLGYDGTRTDGEMWKELKSKLDQAGPEKTIQQWQTSWRDIKTKGSTSLAKRRSDFAATGNKDGPPPEPSQREAMLASILGLEYVLGIDEVPDSMEEVYVVQVGEALSGDGVMSLPLESQVLTLPLPVDGTICLNDDASMSSQTTVGGVAGIVQHDDVEDEPDQQPSTSRIPATPSTPVDPFLRRNAPKKTTPNRSKNPRKERIGVQLDSARREFGDLAAGQTKALEVLSAAAEKQAQALQKLADVAMFQAETERARVEAETLRIKLHAANEERMLAILEKYGSLIEKKFSKSDSM